MAELCTHLELLREQLQGQWPFLKAISPQVQYPGWLRNELRSGACSPHVQADPSGRRRQAGRSQLVQAGPALHSHRLKAARERCGHSALEALGLPTLQPSPGEGRSARGGERLKTFSQRRRWQQQPSWRDSSLTTFPHEQSGSSEGWSHVKHGGTSSSTSLRTTGSIKSSRGSSPGDAAEPKRLVRASSQLGEIGDTSSAKQLCGDGRRTLGCSKHCCRPWCVPEPSLVGSPL
ncbi:uncharacterized protein LOC132321909 [Gavia stellata]|uniref:uncharacterized protein LOC132321909 n=1 Tax=Gavia stellata TaxID=37040 RepID=UPI00289EB513|nr:uncharacterized protein LOC132321909 [Gavia stellata]